MYELKNGFYKARVLTHYIATSSKGTASIKFQFELLDAPDKRTIWGDLWLTDAALENTFRTLFEAFGWRGQNLESLHYGGQLNEMECSLVVENETYEDKTRPKVKFINAPGGGYNQDNAADDRTLAQVAALNSRLRAYAAKNKVKLNDELTSCGIPSSGPSGTGAPDDDLPF